jgi:anhydro-N-acetylmuramic acid kinase
MHSTSSKSVLYIGLMSGTSLDGVDGALASIPAIGSKQAINTLATAYIPFPAELRTELLALQTAGENEIHREALTANLLTRHYAQCVAQLLAQVQIEPAAIRAIGVHGQTIRHRPESGYTRQTNNPALLAELTGIDIIADFRSRDIAAGGQGAPLVPAFHQALFADPGEIRVLANIGGISNISILDGSSNGHVIGFDTGPGNVLMDAWCAQHQGKRFDADGAWAASGTVIPALLQALCNDPFFSLAPPKSTGRDLFHSAWLARKLAPFSNAEAVDVQATLAAFTARTLADVIGSYAPDAQAVYICGGGAYNTHLLQCLQHFLQIRGQTARVLTTDTLGISPNHVEALAFAWLAQRFTERQAGNLPQVTGANGSRILGALYPAV